MPALRILTNFAAGERVTAARLNDMTVNALNDFILYKPICHIYQSSVQSIPSNTNTIVQFHAVKYDHTSPMADIANNRIAINTPGLYRLSAQAVWGGSTTAVGFRYAHIGKNNAPICAHTGPGVVNGGPTRAHLSVIERCAAGDYLTLTLGQTQGAALSTENANYGGVFLSAEWIAA